MKVILASQNRHKLTELQVILAHYGIEVVLQSDIGLHIEVEETGKTFAENSMLKAQAVMRASGFPAISDDSGLMVEALGGAPGVYSARFGGTMNRTDRDRTAFLLKQMEGEKNRAAKFVCVITLLLPSGRSFVATGECRGEITHSVMGDGGFGYDPIFYVPEEGCTLAELSETRKNEISHRANALKCLAEQLQKENNDDFK